MKETPSKKRKNKKKTNNRRHGDRTPHTLLHQFQAAPTEKESVSMRAMSFALVISSSYRPTPNTRREHKLYSPVLLAAVVGNFPHVFQKRLYLVVCSHVNFVHKTQNENFKGFCSELAVQCIQLEQILWMSFPVLRLNMASRGYSSWSDRPFLCRTMAFLRLLSRSAFPGSVHIRIRKSTVRDRIH